MTRLAIIAAAVAAGCCSIQSTDAFSHTSFGRSRCFVSTEPSPTLLLMAPKGFGSKEEPRKKSAGQIDREQKSKKYDEISQAGGQEYRVYVRKFGSDDTSWFPAGSIAVPRGSQVSDAIFANEDGLKQAIVKTYPKLRGQENEFEFGFNLKVYPDDPVEVATKGQKSAGPSIGNWISNVLSPVDASKVPPPPMKE